MCSISNVQTSTTSCQLIPDVTIIYFALYTPTFHIVSWRSFVFPQKPAWAVTSFQQTLKVMSHLHSMANLHCFLYGWTPAPFLLFSSIWIPCAAAPSPSPTPGAPPPQAISYSTHQWQPCLLWLLFCFVSIMSFILIIRLSISFLLLDHKFLWEGSMAYEF